MAGVFCMCRVLSGGLATAGSQAVVTQTGERAVVLFTTGFSSMLARNQVHALLPANTSSANAPVFHKTQHHAC